MRLALDLAKDRFQIEQYDQVIGHPQHRWSITVLIVGNRWPDFGVSELLNGLHFVGKKHQRQTRCARQHKLTVAAGCGCRRVQPNLREPSPQVQNRVEASTQVDEAKPPRRRARNRRDVCGCVYFDDELAVDGEALLAEPEDEYLAVCEQTGALLDR